MAARNHKNRIDLLRNFIHTALFTFSVMAVSFTVGAQTQDKFPEPAEYFASLEKQSKWERGQQYLWSFYLCGNKSQLQSASEALKKRGFINLKIYERAFRSPDGMISVLFFEKTGDYSVSDFTGQVKELEKLSNHYHLNSFSEYGGYEIVRPVDIADAEKE